MSYIQNISTNGGGLKTMLARNVQGTVAPPLVSLQESNSRDQLICALVRRYLLLAQVDPSEWNKNEHALLLLADSILSRYPSSP